ncbi:Cullin family-domain-containing protein [Tirmania nivea]|nr:Cullin family-domain-containing protein [Tirmania nivea]
MSEVDYCKSPASSQQPKGKKRKQSPSASSQHEGPKYRSQQQQHNQQQHNHNQQQVQQKQHQQVQQPLPQESRHPQTISELFAAVPSSNGSRPNTPTTTSSSTSKRPRSSIEPTAEIYKSRYTTAPPTPSTMLNFSNQNKVTIDLTDSSPNSHATGTVNRTSTPRLPRVPFQPGPHSAAQKLVVKNLRTTVKGSPEVYYEQTWKSLDAALTAIFSGERISTSLEELYRGTENLCRADKSALTYEKLKTRMDGYVGGKLKDELNERAGRSDDEVVVKAVEAAWTKWCSQLNMIRSIFLYLDRSYLLSAPNLQTIWETGLSLFRTHIASDDKIGPRFLRGIFSLFEKDRQSQGAVEISSLRPCIRMLSNLNIYTSDFEPEFISISRDYFSRFAEREAHTKKLAGYLAECDRQLDRESCRCDKFQLDLSTKRELESVLEEQMVENQMLVLTDTESVGALLKETDIKSLASLSSLLNRVGDAGALLKPAWENYIIVHGTSIIQDQDTEMVSHLLEFKSSLDKIWAGPFKKNDDLAYSLRESFSTFINARNPKMQHANNSKPAEMIAKYVDLLLRSGVKALTGSTTRRDRDEAEHANFGDEDAELAIQLENVLDLFRFIHGKDVFEAFYKKDLARRLLMGRSASADAERSMLTKLKTECGSGFTHNLECMFKDMELSKETMNGFKSSKAGIDKSNGVDLNVHILSMSAWPTYPDVPISLPEDLAEYLETFKEFYVEKHKGKKLMWRHALAHCVLKAHFPRGNKELVVSAFQAVVLLLFNSIGPTQSLSYTSIMEASGLPDREINRTLQSLACGKFRVLVKTPRGKDVNKTDTFTLNNSFEDNKFRIKINQIQLKETKEENKETHERVAQDRQYETQAAIIRIMKSRKTIKHVELIQQTIEQTKNRGVLDVSEIKQNIEKLIDKEYMERLEDDVYHYVT